MKTLCRVLWKLATFWLLAKEPVLHVHMHTLNIYGGKANRRLWGPLSHLSNCNKLSFLGGKAASAWSLPLTSIWCRAKRCVELYLHSCTFTPDVDKLTFFSFNVESDFMLVSKMGYSVIYFRLKQIVYEFILSSTYLFICLFVNSFTHLIK
jgi:hypothetical protein